MNAPDWKCCSEEELWKYVAWHLALVGAESVLVGGSVVAIYSKGAYRSGDLDLIVQDNDSIKVDDVLTQLGFSKIGRHYQHPECPHLFVEFPPGPLAIGANYRIVPDALIHQKRRLLLLSPTDCVCDRLASYIHFKSRDALNQAMLVAQSKPIDWEKVKNWCRKEKGMDQFNELTSLLKDQVKQPLP